MFVSGASDAGQAASWTAAGGGAFLHYRLLPRNAGTGVGGRHNLVCSHRTQVVPPCRPDLPDHMARHRHCSCHLHLWVYVQAGAHRCLQSHFHIRVHQPHGAGERQAAAAGGFGAVFLAVFLASAAADLQSSLPCSWVSKRPPSLFLHTYGLHLTGLPAPAVPAAGHHSRHQAGRWAGQPPLRGGSRDDAPHACPVPVSPVSGSSGMCSAGGGTQTLQHSSLTQQKLVTARPFRLPPLTIPLLEQNTLS